MKKDILGILTFFDLFLGIGMFITGIVVTFTYPWWGWGLIVAGVWSLLHLYYLVSGVEEIIKDETK